MSTQFMFTTTVDRCPESWWVKEYVLPRLVCCLFIMYTLYMKREREAGEPGPAQVRLHRGRQGEREREREYMTV